MSALTFIFCRAGPWRTLSNRLSHFGGCNDMVKEPVRDGSMLADGRGMEDPWRAGGREASKHKWDGTSNWARANEQCDVFCWLLTTYEYHRNVDHTWEWACESTRTHQQNQTRKLWECNLKTVTTIHILHMSRDAKIKGEFWESMDGSSRWSLSGSSTGKLVWNGKSTYVFRITNTSVHKFSGHAQIQSMFLECLYMQVCL